MKIERMTRVDAAQRWLSHRKERCKMLLAIDIDDRAYGLLKYFEKSLRVNDKKDNNDDIKTELLRAVINGIPLELLLCEIMDMSSVSTEKTGRWEWVQYDSNPNIGNWHCSECDRMISGAITSYNPVYVYKYCPNCGAKMEVKE